ncbi:hypothetical protein HR45_03445 [Shewanella mangrovi]|uniref:HTH araC/xylS-type domain-containing protein n=1 Tax=Shewanella mangrovi TaxID=1515746 RepID=A0A094K1H3_9GAMM|nr:AraC family transcriptional regulator [Shewanella mangrovi]KFZ38496.1 hypothetical protein HR45_03445 [Shewanella mangrovi]
MRTLSNPACQIQHRLLDTLPGVELVQARYQQFSFDKHVHDDLHIGVVDVGAQQFMHKGQRYLLAPKRLSIINPDEVHDGQAANDSDYQVQLLRISTTSLALFAQSMGYQPQEFFLRGPEIEDAELYQQLLTLHYAAAQQGTPLALDSLLVDILSHLLKRYGEHAGDIVGSARFSPRMLAQLKDYLLTDLSRSYRLTELAALFALSEHQFLRRFRQTLGITPHAYLLALRVDYARQLLRTNQPLSMVATQAGFYDQSHLTHAFKRRYNITPARYRQQLQQCAVFYNTAINGTRKLSSSMNVELTH